MRKWLYELYSKLPVIRDLDELKRMYWAQQQAMTTATVIQTLETLKAGNERYRDPKRLLVHGLQCWSQNYEDGMIAEIFRRIGTTTKTFLEIGVENGTQNNTMLWLSAGWSGWWIDGDEACCNSISTQLRNMPQANQRLKIKQAFVTPENIRAILQELGVPSEIDLFSLDIDLNTYHIWAALTEFRPRVIVVEYNGAFPPEQVWILPLQPIRRWDYGQAFGASLKAFELLGAQFGYSLVGCDVTGINAFFVRNDLLNDSFAAPFTAENHHEPPRYHLLHRMAHRAEFYAENDALK